MENGFIPMVLALEALDVLDNGTAPTPDLVRLANAAGPVKFHNELRRTLLGAGWKRGNKPRTNKDLATSPWLSPWGDMVQAQTEALAALCSAVVDLSHPGTQVVDLDEAGVDTEGADNGQ